MWITTIAYDLAAIRQLGEGEFTSLQSSINNKKNELKAIDGGGESTLEYPAPIDYNNIPLDQTTLIVKRAWNQQASAQAFVDHFAVISQITATLEEQV